MGPPLAHWLIDAQGRTSGIGAGIAEFPSVSARLLINTVTVFGAAALSAAPAARAAAPRRLVDTFSTVA